MPPLFVRRAASRLDPNGSATNAKAAASRPHSKTPILARSNPMNDQRMNEGLSPWRMLQLTTWLEWMQPLLYWLLIVALLAFCSP